MEDSKRGVIVNRMGVFVAIPIAFVNDKRITNTGRCLYMLLSSYTSAKADEPIAFPSYETIMERLDWGGRETVAAALLNLMQHGWIERKRRYSNSSVYTINYAPGKYRSEIELSPVVRKANHHKFGNRTTDSSETEPHPEVLNPDVLQQEAVARDAAARGAGIDRQPSIRSKKAKAAAKTRELDKYNTDDLQGYPSLQIYWDVFRGVLLPRELAQKIVDSVGEPTRWEETCEEWAKGNPTTGKTWNPLSIDKMLDLYRAKCAQGRAKQNGKAPSPSQRAQLAEIEARAGAVLGAA